MVFGICTNMNARSASDTGIDQAGYAKALGLDYLELSVDRMAAMDSLKFDSFRASLASSPMPCRTCNNFIDPSVRLFGPSFDKNRFENYVKTALERVKAAGAKKVVFGSAKARTMPASIGAEEGRALLKDRILFITAAAETLGIEIELEHLNRIECNTVNTFEESSRIVKEINRPALRSIFDTYHFGVGNEDLALVRENARWIGHIHFAALLERHMPAVPELEQMGELLAVIREIPYDDTLSLEAYFPDHRMDDGEFKASVDYMRHVLNGN